MAALELKLNPDLDLAGFAARYAQKGFVQIPDILDPEAAERLRAVLENQVDWRLVFPEPVAGESNRAQVVKLTRQDAARLGQAALKPRIDAVLDRARRNLGYLYYSYPLVDALQQGWDRGHAIHEVLEFLNGEDFVKLGRSVIGRGDITKVDGQATLYKPGNFLTRHTDFGEQRERVTAYTLGMTAHWEPDWGGLLAFLDDRMDIAEAYMPRFNCLTLFDVRKIHSVTAVAPFAGAGRYQVTGWFRNDPVL